MLTRIVAGLGLFALGYYLGKEVGRTQSVRDELEEARQKSSKPDETQAPVKGEDPVT
jgi:hypothetical protein